MVDCYIFLIRLKQILDFAHSLLKSKTYKLCTYKISCNIYIPILLFIRNRYVFRNTSIFISSLVTIVPTGSAKFMLKQPYMDVLAHYF